MQFFQKILIRIYSFTKRLGLLDNPIVQHFFLFFCFPYKKYPEDPFLGLTKQHLDLFKGGYILNIDSNIGFEPQDLLQFFPSLKLFNSYS